MYMCNSVLSMIGPVTGHPCESLACTKYFQTLLIHSNDLKGNSMKVDMTLNKFNLYLKPITHIILLFIPESL